MDVQELFWELTKILWDQVQHQKMDGSKLIKDKFGHSRKSEPLPVALKVPRLTSQLCHDFKAGRAVHGLMMSQLQMFRAR